MMGELGMEKLPTNLAQKLSICIPTYNRIHFLAWTVARAIKDFPDVQLIVSDDGSDDGTDTIAAPGLRYLRQSKNIGPFPNMRAVLLEAKTEYCVFLGDDDYLVPEEVQKGVDFLEAHPDVVCYYAPCQLYDEVKGEPAWEAFYPGEDKTYRDASELWNFVMQKHVWPEHAIYRRKGLEKILQPRQKAYWCFIDAANAFKEGPIHIAKTPYYRNLTNHPVGFRQKLGDQQCLTEFESYRAGLECMAYSIFHKWLNSGDHLKLKEAICNGIRQFIYLRYEVARRILQAQGRDAEANVLEQRMVITGF
jgi:glycosyltransferase involved in cell wall biosynthesis